MNLRKWIPIAAMAIALTLVGMVAIPKLRGAEPMIGADGTIAIPADLRTEFDRAFADYKAADEAIRRTQPMLEQIRAISLNRAGVPLAEAPQWKIDLTDGKLKKVPLPR